MDGYLKRAIGLTAYIKVENPRGQRIQQLFVGQEPVHREVVYPAVFVTEQGVPQKYGSQRQKTGTLAVDALRQYLHKHTPVDIEPVGSFRVV